MTGIRAFVLLMASLLVAACATAPDAPAPDAAGASSPVPSAPESPARAEAPRGAATTKSPERRPSEWPAARARIVAALTDAADVTVYVQPDGALQLVLPGADAFARDRSEPKAALRTTLDRVVGALAAAPRTELLVLGHTDSIGSELHNLALSIRRAEAVTEYLRTRGIALTRLTADGRGEAEPIADNATDAGRKLNRRVEIVIRPLE